MGLLLICIQRYDFGIFANMELDYDFNLTDYVFDLAVLWKVFESQPTFNPEKGTIVLEYEDVDNEVDFIQFAVNKNKCSDIADPLHLMLFEIVTPFAGQQIYDDIKQLESELRSFPADKDFFLVKRRRLLTKWKLQINPDSRDEHIEDFIGALEANLDFYLKNYEEILDELTKSNRINLQLNQNQLAAVFILLIGKAAFLEKGITKPRSYFQLLDIFESFKFKDQKTSEYKDINRTSFLKKINAVVNKERDWDRIKEDFIEYFDDIFGVN